MTEDNRKLPDQPKADGPDTDKQGGDEGVMEALIADSRIENRIVMEDVSTLTEPQRQRIRAEFHRRREANEITIYRCAKGIDEHKSVLSQILNDRYPKGKGRGICTIDRVLIKIDKWLAQIDATARAPKRAGFVWTKIANEGRAVARTTVELQTIGVVYGQAGIGKTLLLEAMLPSFPGSVLVTIDDSNNTVASFLRDLALALKLERGRSRSENFRAVCDRLKDSGRLLIVDEAHLADSKILNAIRQIHDKTGIPVLLAGQPSLHRKLLQGRGDDHVGAMLYSRIGIIRDLEARCKGQPGEPLYSVADIRKVFARSSMRIHHDALDWLVGISNMPDVGGLRAAGNAMRLAQLFANKAGQSAPEITLERLLQASRSLHGQERAALIAKRIKERTKVA